MKIATAVFYSTRELMSRLKRVVMLQDKSVLPYANAEITVTDISTDQLAPAQLYVLRGEFDKVRELRWSMLEQFGVDILRLPDSKMRDGKIVPADADRAESVGFVEFTLDTNPDETITVLPPVVEGWTEDDKSYVNIINDGMHRCFAARISRIIPAVVKISKVPKNLPYYAFPLVEGWRGVQMVDRLDARLLKKYHRFREPEYKRYYRDFNSAFTNVGGPRGKG